jgi:type IV pilus assembly protein PilA
MPARDESGFTLIEVLVVMLVIAALAAIALPTFLGQSDKARDADAKSDARALVTLVQACFVDGSRYDPCTNTALRAGGGLPLPAVDGAAPAAGEVSVVAVAAMSFEIAARSTSGVTYRIVKADGAPLERACSPVGDGGCASGSW